MFVVYLDGNWGIFETSENFQGLDTQFQTQYSACGKKKKKTGTWFASHNILHRLSLNGLLILYSPLPIHTATGDNQLKQLQTHSNEILKLCT